MTLERKHLTIVLAVIVIGISFIVLGFYTLNSMLERSRNQKRQYDLLRDQTYHDAMAMSEVKKKNHRSTSRNRRLSV